MLLTAGVATPQHAKLRPLTGRSMPTTIAESAAAPSATSATTASAKAKVAAADTEAAKAEAATAKKVAATNNAQKKAGRPGSKVSMHSISRSAPQSTQEVGTKQSGMKPSQQPTDPMTRPVSSAKATGSSKSSGKPSASDPTAPLDSAPKNPMPYVTPLEQEVPESPGLAKKAAQQPVQFKSESAEIGPTGSAVTHPDVSTSSQTPGIASTSFPEGHNSPSAIITSQISIPADEQSAEARADESAHPATLPLDAILPCEAVSHTTDAAQSTAHASNPTLPLHAAAAVPESIVSNANEDPAPDSQQLLNEGSSSKAQATDSNPAEDQAAKQNDQVSATPDAATAGLHSPDLQKEFPLDAGLMQVRAAVLSANAHSMLLYLTAPSNLATPTSPFILPSASASVSASVAASPSAPSPSGSTPLTTMIRSSAAELHKNILAEAASQLAVLPATVPAMQNQTQLASTSVSSVPASGADAGCALPQEALCHALLPEEPSVCSEQDLAEHSAASGRPEKQAATSASTQLQARAHVFQQPQARGPDSGRTAGIATAEARQAEADSAVPSADLTDVSLRLSRSALAESTSPEQPSSQRSLSQLVADRRMATLRALHALPQAATQQVGDSGVCMHASIKDFYTPSWHVLRTVNIVLCCVTLVWHDTLSKTCILSHPSQPCHVKHVCQNVTMHNKLTYCIRCMYCMHCCISCTRNNTAGCNCPCHACCRPTPQPGSPSQPWHPCQKHQTTQQRRRLQPHQSAQQAGPSRWLKQQPGCTPNSAYPHQAELDSPLHLP